MQDYWVSAAYCFSNTMIGYILIYFIIAVEKLLWVIVGIAMIRNELYLIFLTIYGLYEERFIHSTLSSRFPQNRPDCHIFTDKIIQEARGDAFPSLEIQLVFSVSAFLIVHMILTRQIYQPKMVSVLLLLPALSAAAVCVTNNNTSIQVIIGAIIGSLNGIRRILLYHFYLKFHLYNLGSYRYIGWFIPRKDQDRAVTDNTNDPEEMDQDILMTEGSTKTPGVRTLYDHLFGSKKISAT